MEATVKQHPVKGKGWAVITLRGDALPGAGVRFQLRRSTGRDAILGPNGWQSTELWLAPSDLAPAAGELALTVGPEVVNHMDTANYALLLVGDGVGAKQPLQAGLAWRNIAQLDLGRGKRGGVAVRGEAEEAARRRASAHETGAQQSEDVPAPAPAPSAPQPAPPPVIPINGEATKKGGRAGLIAAVIVVLLLGGGGAWWVLRPAPENRASNAEAEKSAEKRPAEEKKVEEAAKADNKTDIKPETKIEEPKKEAVLPLPPDTGDDLPAGADPLKFAREKLQAGMEPGRAVALAEKLMQRPPAGIDAAFLLYRHAAQKGNASAALKLARLLDPADETPSGSLKKGAESALEWYRSAEASKLPEAAGAIVRLKAWVQKQADAGDAEAQQMLKRFQP